MNEKELEKVFKAFANKRRLLILTVLKKKKELSVGDLASEIKLSFRSTSKHLKVLSGADLVVFEQKSKEDFYRLAEVQLKLIKDIVAVFDVNQVYTLFVRMSE